MHHDAGGPAKHPHHTRQAPIGRLFAIAGTMRGKVLGDVPIGPQARGAAVDQAQLEAELLGDLQGFVGLLGGIPEGALADLQRQFARQYGEPSIASKTAEKPQKNAENNLLAEF